VIYFFRIATIAPGKTASALSYARDVAEYVKSKTGTKVVIGVPIGGQPNRIGWFVDYENLAKLEEDQTKLLQDSEYLAIAAKGGENFVAGSPHDEIWRIL
jgi:hypothetical protein